MICINVFLSSEKELIEKLCIAIELMLVDLVERKSIDKTTFQHTNFAFFFSLQCTRVYFQANFFVLNFCCIWILCQGKHTHDLVQCVFMCVLIVLFIYFFFLSYPTICICKLLFIFFALSFSNFSRERINKVCWFHVTHHAGCAWLFFFFFLYIIYIFFFVFLFSMILTLPGIYMKRERIIVH